MPDQNKGCFGGRKNQWQTSVLYELTWETDKGGKYTQTSIVKYYY